MPITPGTKAPPWGPCMSPSLTVITRPNPEPAIAAEPEAEVEPTRVVDVFLRYLKAEGAHVVFGIPGGLLHPFFEAVELDREMHLVMSKHEEGAAFMADGYARVG